MAMNRAHERLNFITYFVSRLLKNHLRFCKVKLELQKSLTYGARENSELTTTQTKRKTDDPKIDPIIK